MDSNLNENGIANIEIFRFNPSADYEFYFQKLSITFNKKTTLKEVLLGVENLSFDSQILLRVNGLCVFRDIPIYELVNRFGENLTISPLNTRLVSKDLSFNFKAAFSEYEAFFNEYSFIKSADRYELNKFLPLNAISMQSNPHFLGEGFFSYIRFLISKYYDKESELLDYISGAQSGVMSATNLENLLYEKNENLENDINYLIQKVCSFSRDKESGFLWSSFKNKLKKGLDSRLKALKDRINKAESNKAESSLAVFNGYDLKEGKEVVSVVNSIFKSLNQEDKKVNLQFEYAGGYFENILFSDLVQEIWEANFKLASLYNAKIIFGDLESATFAKRAEQKAGITESRVDYINNFVAYASLLLQEDLSLDFNFKESNKSYAMYLFNGFTNDDFLMQDSRFKATKIKTILTPAMLQDFSHLEAFNKEYYLKDSARMRFIGIDSGASGLVVESVGLFRAFNTFSEEGEKILARDRDETKTYFGAEVISNAVLKTKKV